MIYSEVVVAFGDADPEDEWDDGDPFRVRLEILERVLAALRDRRDERFEGRLGEALRLLAKLVDEHSVDQTRLERLRDALEGLG